MVGKWYNFNEMGILTKVEDSEEGFTFTFEQLKEKLKKEGVSLENLKPRAVLASSVDYPISVTKLVNPGGKWSEYEEENQIFKPYKYVWLVEYMDEGFFDERGYGRSRSRYFDGVTGKNFHTDYTFWPH